MTIAAAPTQAQASRTSGPASAYITASTRCSEIVSTTRSMSASTVPVIAPSAAPPSSRWRRQSHAASAGR